MKFKLNLLIFTIAFVIVSPNWNIVGIPISDFIVLIFSIYVFLTIGIELKLIFYYVFFGVLLVLFSRYIFLGIITTDEIKNIFTHFKLAVFANVSYSLVTKLQPENLNMFLLKLLKAIIFASIFIAIIGILQFFQISQIDQIVEFFYSKELGSVVMTNLEYFLESNRVSSIFSGPLKFSGFLIQILVFIMLFRLYLNKYFFLVTLLILSLALILTNSRTALIVFALFIVVYLMYNKSFKILLSVSILGIVSLLFIGSYLSYFSINNIERMQELLLFWETGVLPWNAQLKLDLIPSIYTLVATNWDTFLFGMGIENFQNAFWWKSWEVEYLGLLIKYGVIGFFVIIYWYLKIFKIAYKSFNKFNNVNKQLLLFIMASILTMSILMINQDILFASRWRELFFIFVGIEFGIIKNNVWKENSRIN